jgi:replication-associated recombination protein RarA
MRSAASKRRFAALTAREKLSHAYIFEGGPGAHKLRAAEDFAKAVHCTGPGRGACGTCLSCRKADHGNHEDILYLTREGASIGVKQIEDLQARLRGKPFASERIIAIADEAERMTPQSQNKLLKTLEEPCGGNIILLLTVNADLLLETIRSRCVLLRLDADTDAAASGAFAALADDFVRRLAAGSAYYELSGLVLAAAERDAAGDFLDALELRLRDELPADPCGARRACFLNFIDCTEEARRGLGGGLNAKYALKAMILKMLSCPLG